MNDTATITEVSPRETVTWTMPRATYDLVSRVLETWPYVYGRRPRATVERSLAMLEREVPDIRTGVISERRANLPVKILGRRATAAFRDDWMYRAWTEGPEVGWTAIDTLSQPREGEG